MASLADIRSKYPQYHDLSDQQLADALYEKSYSDMPRADFDAKLGLSAAQPSADPFGHQAVADNLSSGFTAGVNAIPFVGPQILSGLEAVKGMVQGRPQAEVAASDKAQADAHPVAKTVGEFAGPMIALAPLGMTGIGAKALGLSGNLLSRVALGGTSGAMIAGGDTYTRTGDAGAAADAAKWGFGAGAALPAAGRIIKSAWRGVTGNAFDPAEKAIARALQGDQIPVADVPNKLAALGPDAVVADLGPNLQRQAGALASLPGDAQQTVRNALESRAEGTNARIQGDTNTILGPAPVPSEVDTSIKGQMQALGPQYEALFANKARAVNTQPIADALDTDVVNLRGDAQKAARQVRGMLDISGAPGNLDPSPYTLFQTRQAIDGMLEGEANSKVIGYLTGVRQKVDAELAKAVPGIKTVDAQYADLASQREALVKGQQLLDSGRTATRPEELDAMLAAATGGVSTRLTQGARAEVERIIGTTANDLNALKTALKGDGSWNRARLASLFGQDKADRLLAVLDREKRFDATNRIVTQNSETAGRQAAQAEFDTASPSGVRGMTATGLVASALQKVANVGARTRRGATNRRVAEALVSPGGISPRMSSQIAAALQDAQRRGLIPPAAVSDALFGKGGSPTGLKIGQGGKYAFNPASY